MITYILSCTGLAFRFRVARPLAGLLWMLGPINCLDGLQLCCISKVLLLVNV